jgi:hypothetical protein
MFSLILVCCGFDPASANGTGTEPHTKQHPQPKARGAANTLRMIRLLGVVENLFSSRPLSFIETLPLQVITAAWSNLFYTTYDIAIRFGKSSYNVVDISHQVYE